MQNNSLSSTVVETCPSTFLERHYRFTVEFILHSHVALLLSCSGHFPFLPSPQHRGHGPHMTSADSHITCVARLRFGEFFSCSCLPLLPQLSRSIHATWPKPFSRALFTREQQISSLIVTAQARGRGRPAELLVELPRGGVVLHVLHLGHRRRRRGGQRLQRRQLG